jgi:hypothetical protein
MGSAPPRHERARRRRRRVHRQRRGQCRPKRLLHLDQLSSLQALEAITEVFKGSVSTTALDQATSPSICTLDAKVYPWLGAPYQLSVDGAAWPTPQACTPLRFVNDKTGGYGGGSLA